MGFHDFVSETEAAALAGVSVATLRRFIEAGYLNGEEEQDGLRLFSKSEVAALFGVSKHELTTRKATSADIPNFSASSRPLSGNGVLLSPIEQASPLRQAIETVPDVEKSASAIETPPTHVESNEPDVAQQTVANHQEAPRYTSAEVIDAEPEHSFRLENARATPQNARTADTTEIIRLRHLVELQERILALREAELVATQKERDWLRTRIERLEEKQDRDQLLLLTETQMIRRLVARTEERRSPVRMALEWLGFVPPSEQIQHSSVAIVNAPVNAQASETRRTTP